MQWHFASIGSDQRLLNPSLYITPCGGQPSVDVSKAQLTDKLRWLQAEFNHGLNPSHCYYGRKPIKMVAACFWRSCRFTPHRSVKIVLYVDPSSLKSAVAKKKGSIPITLAFWLYAQSNESMSGIITSLTITEQNTAASSFHNCSFFKGEDILAACALLECERVNHPLQQKSASLADYFFILQKLIIKIILVCYQWLYIQCASLTDHRLGLVYKLESLSSIRSMF